MDKSELKLKIENGGWNTNQLLQWVKHLPNDKLVLKPIRHKAGDIYFNPIFSHPLVLVKKSKELWVCALLTTKDYTAGVIEPCQSRFTPNSYFTSSLVTLSDNELMPSRFMGVYDNTKHLREVFKKIKKIML